jgi:hypothetical protein
MHECNAHSGFLSISSLKSWDVTVMILLGLLALIYSSALSWILGQAGSLQICTPLIVDDLCYFVLDILDLWLRFPVLCFLTVLLGLIPLHLVVLGMSCNLSLDDWKLSCHLGTHSGCGKVHEACPPPMGHNISASLVCGCFCLGTLYSCFLPRLPFCILRLLDCVLCGHPRCETCVFASLLRRLLVNPPFCCCKRLLHQRICLLSLLILTLFWALFSLALPRDPNGEGQPKSVYCPLVGDVFCGVFCCTPSLYVWT